MQSQLISWITTIFEGFEEKTDEILNDIGSHVDIKAYIKWQ